MLTAAELRAAFPDMPEETVLMNASDGPASHQSDPPSPVPARSRTEALAGRRMGRKYHNEPTVYGDRTYDSKKEANYAAYLDTLKAKGIILSWVPQVTFPLPKGEKHKVDFLVFYPPTQPGGMPFAGVHEVKGRDLALGRLKRKMVEEIYHVKIEVV